MLDPNKADVQATAVLALVKIGKPAVDRTIKVLNNDDEKLTTFNLRRIKEVNKLKEAPKDRPFVQTAALVLGTIGRADARDALIAALGKEDKDKNKAIIARELAKIPPTPESKQAFKQAFESISLDTIIPPGMNALVSLVEASERFYDPAMVPWLLERAAATKGGGEEKKALQASITVTAMKLAKPDQMDSVKQAVSSYGTKMEKDLFADADKLVKACGDRVACYLAEMEKGANQSQKKQFVGIKAGYMATILGNESTVGELVKRMSSFENAAVRYVAALGIDFLSPKGSKDVAGQLRKIIEKNAVGGDKNKIAGDAPLKQVMYRLDSRAK